jgi:iron(III) transport system ATP-binding protein
MSRALELEGIHKRFGEFVALRSIDLAIESGELVCFLGPSGCGKTTLLRIIAGLERQTSGRVIQNGQDVSNAPPAARHYGIVFQSYALFPNLTIDDNVGYGLVNRRKGRAEVKARVAELLALVGLPQEGRKYPSQLSGGQQQRVAVARALAGQPAVLLADEPTGNLDMKTSDGIHAMLTELQAKKGLTLVIVTHNERLAAAMGTTIHLLDGRVEKTT